MDLTLIIDNYDSFVYNIYQYVAELGSRPIVLRNDEIKLESIEKINPDRIIISPGPGSPLIKEDIGISDDIIREFGNKIPILGVCLGHQIIGYVFNSIIRNARKIYHGKISKINIINNDSQIFKGIPKEIYGTRYHSLVIDEVKKPLIIDAISDEDKEIMAIHHEKYPIFGVQFHPESIGTAYGKQIIKNFLEVK
ncbi:glutamine amidotransferase of anthranilate synthase or aminodeoxychorismate synthase [Caldisphaera lagunensis DSM 15908]|uniref:anthranilate synthase n=1 Tax=Caldisphaera lagunensis (strain DSM 15908 / JCM 11604 / ANMR 0165 / IC-154) TaxID=1056495 RepID=L0A7P3_CALLD|nr:aminodeoxychorismate/anthranilate synthase component II [Caldisphaera lagunensis]AFZ69888.1 glutamine amidotransferase of anthranilate synthase or aminodeoxychorismate synthase [Caldisphaera lagunensis DSM 15908]